MEGLEKPKAPGMKLLAGLCALAASFGVALLWKSDESITLLPMGAVAGVGVGVLVMAGILTMWFRARRRRELRDLRDSALW
jgi:hypothetical protein